MKENWSEGRQDSLCRDCVKYFREHPVFERVLQGFREKYLSYGSFSGTVILRGLPEEEREDLEGFFQKNFHGQKSVSISAARFERALRESRFDGVNPKEVLELYFQEELTGRRERERTEEENWNRMLESVRIQCAGTWAESWVKELEGTRTELYFYLRKRYKEADKSMEELQRLLLLGIRVLNGLPYRRNTAEYLAVFAARMTGNPHGFDNRTKDGAFLRMLVKWDVDYRKILVETSGIFPTFQRQRLYLATGILRDDFSNSVMVSGIRAWTKDGSIHEGMEGFRDTGDPVQVPLSVIAKWSRVACLDQAIYIVENPSVFAMLCTTYKGKKTCMCVNGQPRLSAVLLLDLLAEAGTKVYYAGDFDPEGLLIAQKIKQYYRGEAVYWHMSVSVYEKSLSDERIADRRMKELERIVDEELSELAEALRKHGTAGYQENVWSVYLER